MSQAEIGPDLNAEKYTQAQMAEFKKAFPDQDIVTLARFLIARNGDVAKSTEMLNNHLAWKAKNWPVLKSSCKKELSSGKAYVRGYDKLGHPIIVFHTYLHDPNDRDIDELIRFTAFTFETAIKAMKDKNCKVTVLVNRVGAGGGSDIEFARQLVGVLQNNYPERLYRMIVYPSGVIFYGIWQVVQLFVDPVTKEKVKPVMYLSGVTEFIDIENVPAIMGGKDEFVFNEAQFPDPYPEEVVAAKKAADEKKAANGNGEAAAATEANGNGAEPAAATEGEAAASSSA